MGIAITIIICIALLCIVPSIGTRRPRGYQPTVEPDLEDFFPFTYHSPVIHPNPPTSHGGLSAAKTDEETIRRIGREELAKQEDNSSTGIAFDHRLINRSDY